MCPDCAKPYAPDPALLRRFAGGKLDGQYRQGTGCPKCLNSGSRGRCGIYELLDLNQDIQLAGLSMKVFGDIPLWIAAAVVFFKRSEMEQGLPAG